MICISTRWFKLMLGKCNWLAGQPLGGRFMWRPRQEGPVVRYRTIPCAWDGWVTRYGFVVNQRNYEAVRG